MPEALYCWSFSTEDSRKPFALEGVRHGRGWRYRRRWRAGPSDRWLKTSNAGMAFIQRRYSYDVHPKV